ncbi:MAG: hypothetical protein ACI4T5_10450 [Prevotella sp.]
MEQDQGQDFIVSMLLAELKSENDRKGRLIQGLVKVICGCLIAILATVGGFLWYLNQYDFSSTETITTTATGVYALIDSEGNVIAQDLSPEEIEAMMEVLNGYSEEYNNTN